VAARTQKKSQRHHFAAPVAVVPNETSSSNKQSRATGDHGRRLLVSSDWPSPFSTGRAAPARQFLTNGQKRRPTLDGGESAGFLLWNSGFFRWKDKYSCTLEVWKQQQQHN